MTNFIERVIEKLINDGLVTESELAERIEEAKKESPITKFNDDADAIGFLITFLMQHDENISFMITMAMQRIANLEQELEELKNA